MTPPTPYAKANTTPYWFTTVPDSEPCPALAGDTNCDLAIIGGGFTGLWSALHARRRHPDANIMLFESKRCGQEASGRNGGFCAPSISHGVSNALTRWPDEAETLIRLGRENLDAFANDLEIYCIDADFERAGKLNLAATPWQVHDLKNMAANYERFGIDCRLMAGDALREKFDSPVYSAGLFEPNYALVNPSKLAAGLRKSCLAQGIRIFEDTPVKRASHERNALRLETPNAVVTAKHAILATNAAVPILRKLRQAILPIFDYSLVTEPLSDAQLAGIGWTGRHGAADTGNQFHYLRKTVDNRILWAGFDAIYHYGSRRDAELMQREETFALLAEQFATVFPTLADVKFDYKWGGIIDTSARTTFFVGTECAGKLAYAMGFTGQGVSASRFAALTMLDLLQGDRTERTSLKMLNSAPVRFPPEPFRSLAIRLAQKGLAHEDKTGHRPLFLRALDRFGVGFDS
ncbi:NAD(P)/FAD-dependent oxidoreductase [Roseovarius aestuarii]|uniref:Gamma-glutamylputrescine oxidoreductase n=1 Tax=Roseovarius aestuarii TaxID=475083 RepID=A0A1X7BWJ5_9RHOB|nr:FAD-dependent oxidoreductase [Roseovarius aestuarii]SMC13875.1 Gamma-glutamylputrescine oxidoreductase [Roseovarius aestuarii]